MKCSRCQIDLPRGAAHVSPEGCIDALQEALERARTCASCGSLCDTVIHPGCVPAELLNRGAKLGTGVLEKRVTEWLANTISGQGTPPGDADRGRGKRWKP